MYKRLSTTGDEMNKEKRGEGMLYIRYKGNIIEIPKTIPELPNELLKVLKCYAGKVLESYAGESEIVFDDCYVCRYLEICFSLAISRDKRMVEQGNEDLVVFLTELEKEEG